MELFEVVRRTVDEEGTRSGEFGEEEGIRTLPFVADRRLVQYLKARSLTLRHHRYRHTGRGQMLVLCYVLEPVAEVFGGKRMAVRPLMPLAQMQSKNAAVPDIDSFTNLQCEG